MPKFRVVFQQMASTLVTVEDAEDYEDAIEQAYQDTPGGICAQCSGWGNPPGIDLSGDWEVVEVDDEDGNAVWTEERS